MWRDVYCSYMVSSNSQHRWCVVGVVLLKLHIWYLIYNNNLSKNSHRTAGPKICLHVLGSEDYLASSGSFTPTKGPHSNEWIYISNSGTYPKQSYIIHSRVPYTPPFFIRAQSHPRTFHDHRLFSVLPMSTYTNKTSLAVCISSHVLYSEFFLVLKKNIMPLLNYIYERR